MIKVFQKRWYDIHYKDFCQMNSKQVADAEFYKNFYTEFYKKYLSWDSLPTSYSQTRKNVAIHLATMLNDKKAQTVLSLGCGSGVVEKELVAQLPNLQLYVYEPDETNFKWLKSLANLNLCYGEFPQCLPANLTYDAVYLCDVDPVFSDAEYVQLLKQIKTATSAPIILTHVLKPLPTLFSHIKYWSKYLLAQMKLFQLGQLQGYSRYFSEHQKIFKRAGYRLVNQGDLSKNLMWMEISPINSIE